jgi:hypothetical protein
VPGEILILAAGKKLLNDATRGDEGNGQDMKEDKSEAGDQTCLWMGCM